MSATALCFAWAWKVRYPPGAPAGREESLASRLCGGLGRRSPKEGRAQPAGGPGAGTHTLPVQHAASSDAGRSPGWKHDSCPGLTQPRPGAFVSHGLASNIRRGPGLRVWQPSPFRTCHLPHAPALPAFPPRPRLAAFPCSASPRDEDITDQGPHLPPWRRNGGPELGCGGHRWAKRVQCPRVAS